MDHDFPDMMDEQESLVQSADSAEGPFPRAGWQVLLEVEFAKQNALLRDVGLQMISTVKETLKEELAGKHSLGARGIRHVRTDAEMPRGLSTVVSSEADSLGVQSLPLGMKFQPSTASRSASRDPPVTTTAPPEKNVSSTNSWDSIYQHRDFRASRRKAQAAAKKISELRGGASSLGLVGEMDDPKLSESWSLRTVRSSAFRAGVPIVILTNLILLGVEVDMSAQLPPNAQIEAFQVANIIIVCFFFGEILLKLHAYGCKMMYFGKDRWWNWSDLLIFSMSVFEIVGEAMASVVFASQMDPTQLRTMRFLRMARALRGVRVLRLLQYLSALRTIVFSIVSTMGSVFWTSLLLVILFYLFGVLNTQIATDHCRALTHAEVPQKCDPELMRFWSSVPQAMLTLFLSITNGVSWDDCLQPLWDVSRVALVSLIVYIVITVFAVLNTAYATFVSEYTAARERFAELLNKHLLPRGDPPSSTSPPGTSSMTHETRQQGGQEGWDQHVAAAETGQEPAQPAAADEDDDEDTHCDGTAFTAEERAIQEEWAAHQKGTFWSDIPPSVPLSPNSHADLTQLTHGCWRLEVRPDQGVSIRKISGIPRTVIEGDEGDTLSSPPFPIGLEATFAPMTPHHWVLTVVATPALSNYEAASMLLSVGDKILFERDPATLTWRLRIETQSKDCHPTITRMRQRREDAREHQAQQEAQQRAAAAASSTTPAASSGSRPGAPNQQPPTALAPQLTPIAEERDSRTDHHSQPNNTATATSHSMQQAHNNNPRPQMGETASSASASSSHEPPRSYYPTARPKPDSPETTTHDTTTPQQQKPLDDGRDLRRSQRDRKPPESQQQPPPAAATPLAQLLQDGRTLRRGARERNTKTTTTTTAQAVLPPHNTTTTSTITDSTSIDIPTNPDARPDNFDNDDPPPPPDTQSLMQTGKPTSTSNKQPPWATQPVDTAPAFEDSQGHGEAIANAADAALVDLLVVLAAKVLDSYSRDGFLGSLDYAKCFDCLPPPGSHSPALTITFSGDVRIRLSWGAGGAEPTNVLVVVLAFVSVTGVFCNMAIESARADKDMATMRQMQKHEAQVDALRGVFEEINPDGMGVISLEELKEALKQEKLRSFMHSMDIATDDIVTLFMVIDADGSGDITLDEFVYGCMNLAGPAKQLQVARMGYENTIIRKELKALRVDLRKLRQYIAALENNHVHSLGGGRAAPLENYPSVRV
ncbi:Sodium channel protein type 5 subunit alpha [Symbiodinium microadriaticum]|uniref:Sodium channel protein type 5 subunit alpha n=1 Tax=Symbiodinium microadriaticum TaxID=2951 RepID=A0A1Q9EQ71_SYMMI|nr:Sodium channel protein type 5 subunit alpha [Symbiodinium microadriaticum]